MTSAAIGRLALETIRAPRSAAAQLIGLGLPRELLWTALALVVILNALIFTLTNMVSPPPAEMPMVVMEPLPFALLLGAALVASIFALFWVGRGLGGQARLDDLMVLLIWLQSLRVALQLALLVLMPVVPALASLIVLAASILGIWILVNFVDVAQGFDSLLKSLGVLILSTLGMAIALSLVLSLFGGAILGIPSNV
ncbi:MAG: YIP1 family protein [Paracoccaceae bacterium]